MPCLSLDAALHSEDDEAMILWAKEAGVGMQRHGVTIVKTPARAQGASDDSAPWEQVVKPPHGPWERVESTRKNGWRIVAQQLPTRVDESCWDVFLLHDSGTRVPVGENERVGRASASIEMWRLCRVAVLELTLLPPGWNPWELAS
jgi:hypothetical protein